MGNLSIKAFWSLLIVGFMFSGEQSPKVVVVSADALNLLYIGVKNYVSVAVSEVADEDIIVEISDGKITKTDQPGEYICTIGKIQKSKVALTVSFRKQDGTIEKAGSREFRLREVYPLELTYGSLSSGQHSLGALVVQNRLGVPFHSRVGWHFDYSVCVVKHYKATLVSVDGEVVTMNVEGNSLKEINSILHSTPLIQKVIISDVIAEYTATNHTVRISEELVIEIKTN